MQSNNSPYCNQGTFYAIHLTILVVTGEATSSVATGAVIGGTVSGSIALMALVCLLLGCLIYNKKRKRRRLHMRYVVIQHAFLKMLVILECFIVVRWSLEELLCQSPTLIALILFNFSARNECLCHTYEGGVEVEMQQFDKHGYYFCNLLYACQNILLQYA